MHRNPPAWLKWQTSLIIVIHCYIRRLWGFFNPTNILRFQRGSVVFRCHSLSRHSNKQPPSCELLRLEIRSRCFFQIEHSSVFIALPWSLISRNSSEFFCILPLPWGFNMFFFVYNANQKRVHTCMVHKLKCEQVSQKCLNQRRQGIQNQNRDQGSVKSFSCGRDC